MSYVSKTDITKDNKGGIKMALISCPNCKNPVSDKAAVCPNCGYAGMGQCADAQNKIKCEDCGNEFENNLVSCPVCGCPASISGVKKGKKKTVVISVIIFLLIVCALGINFTKQAALTEYNANMTEAAQTMLDGAAKAENVGNLVKSVWNNAIYKKRDDTTDKYTMQNGKFVDDFNDALKNLYDDSEQNEIIAEIRDNQNQVAGLMRALKNPPKKYEEAYSILKTFYDNYVKLTNSAVNPTGSLKTFSEDFNRYDTDTVNAFENMKLYLD